MKVARRRLSQIILIGLMVEVLFLVNPSPLSHISPAYAQTSFEDGFESGSFSNWTGTRVTIGDLATVVTTNPKSGSYSAKFRTNGTASGTEWSTCYYTLSTTTNDIYIRAYFYISEGLPLDNEADRFGLITIYDPNTDNAQASVRVIETSGAPKFQLSILAGTSWLSNGTEAILPQEGTWYSIELHFKTDETQGEGQVWINGLERIKIENQNTAGLGNIKQVNLGLVSVNVQHPVTLYCDAAAIDSEYVGQPYNFAVIGDPGAIGTVNNVYQLLDSLDLTYKKLMPSAVTDESVLRDVDGVISFVSNAGTVPNASLIKSFASNHVVISHGYDFSHMYYPSLDSFYTRVANVSTVKYLTDWGNFRMGDKPELRSTDNGLGVILSGGLSNFPNITKIAILDNNYTAFFRMAGATSDSGFYVIDLLSTRNSTLTANNWHLFPAINLVHSIPIGKYARWMANGLGWYSLDWVNNFMNILAKKDPSLVELRNIGTTVEGRPINVLFIGKGSTYVLIDGAIHGDEKTGTAASLRTAELLVDYYDANNSYWRSRLDTIKVIIVPVSNPDGYYHGTRENANGKDLNRNYPPDGALQLTEPESRAFANLLGNYTAKVFLNLHTYIFQTLFYQDSSTPLTEPYQTFALNTWNLADEHYRDLRHSGTIYGKPLGQINGIINTALQGPVYKYAWWKYQTISCLLEFYDASPLFNLLGQEYFCSVIFTAIQNFDKVADTLVYSTGNIVTTSRTASTFAVSVNSEQLVGNSVTKVFTDGREKPLRVFVDGVSRNEGSWWSWGNTTDTVIVYGATQSILLEWSSYPSWDLNQDGQVDMKDLAIVARAFGSILGSLNWNPQADINLDMKVDIMDVTMVAIHFGEKYV